MVYIHTYELAHVANMGLTVSNKKDYVRLRTVIFGKVVRSGFSHTAIVSSTSVGSTPHTSLSN